MKFDNSLVEIYVSIFNSQTDTLTKSVAFHTISIQRAERGISPSVTNFKVKIAGFVIASNIKSEDSKKVISFTL
jgi:hypothetical protein